MTATATPARITVQEIAGRLAMGKESVYRLLDRGEIPAIRHGRSWLISRSAYERWEQSFGSRGQGSAEPQAAPGATK